MAGRAPDQDFATAKIERHALLGEIGHPPETDHLLMGLAHVPGIWPLGELVDRHVVVAMQMAEGDQQLHARRVTTVARAPFFDALVDYTAQVPVIAMLGKALVEQQHAVIAEIERRERRFVAIGLVLSQDRGVSIVPVDVNRRIGVVHRGFAATDPPVGEVARRRQVALEVDRVGRRRRHGRLAERGQCGGHGDDGGVVAKEGAAIHVSSLLIFRSGTER